jgi:two-component system, OmpR family, sensor histidine kinase QseC
MNALFQSISRASIARRIGVALLLACALVWAAVYVLGRSNVLTADTGNFDREMRVRAAAATRLAERHADPRELALALSGLAEDISAQELVQGVPPGFMAFRVFDAHGAVVASGGDGPAQWPHADERDGFYTHESQAHTHRLFRSTTADARYRIEIAQSHASRQKIFDQVMFSYEGLQPLLLGFPLLLLPIWLAVHTGLSPLRRLSAELASRHPADLTPIRAPFVYRELAPLAHELNGALARLAALLQRERNFLADAAHQLRTPLALIGAQCDNLQHAQSKPAREEALRRLQGGLLRAGRLVNQLLALARLEADVEDSPVATDIADVARDCLAAHAAAARAQGIELAYVGPDSLTHHCPGHAVESIVDNLVGNAIRYGRTGGQVELRVLALEGVAVQVQVSDDGPGIAPGERAQLFERFRRGANVSVSGSGLGLAIVKSAARQLGARIEIVPGLGGKGIGFSLTWPNAAAGLGAWAFPKIADPKVAHSPSPPVIRNIS